MDYQYTVTAAADNIRPKGFFDGLGVFLSQVCLAHCFLLPAVLAVLPSIDVHSLPGGEVLHFALLLLSTPTSIYALLSGRRYHGRSLPLQLGVLGLAALWGGSTLDFSHLILSHGAAHGISALGSVILIGAHIANRRATKAAAASPCGCGHNH